MKALKERIMIEKENLNTDPVYDYDNDLYGWQYESVKPLTQKINRFNTQRDLKQLKRIKYCKSKQHTFNQDQTSDIDHLKQQALKLDNEILETKLSIKISKYNEIRNTEAQRRQDLQNLFRLTKNGIISNAITHKKQNGLKKKKLIKINPRSLTSIKRLRDNLIKQWDDAKKCISTLSSTKESQKNYLNYSQRIRSSTISKNNRMMRVTIQDSNQPKISLNSTPKTPKIKLINAFLKDRFY